MEMSSKFALWISKDGRFGVMDTVKGEVWHPLDNDVESVRVQRLGLDRDTRPVFSITFIGALETEEVKSGTGFQTAA